LYNNINIVPKAQWAKSGPLVCLAQSVSLVMLFINSRLEY
jgi:hypothetical protein